MALAAIVLADSRFPGGGHVHSGGVEEAVARGLVTGLDDLGAFLHGRLRTTGLVAAGFAAAAARLAAGGPRSSPIKAPMSCVEIDERRLRLDRGDAGDPEQAWRELDAELDARTPSPAQRAASRAQGRATLRAARQAWPSPVLDALLAANPRPHHALLAGAVVGVDGGSPGDAARCVAYLAVTGPAAAAVRLLGLDPLSVNALVVALGPDLARVVGAAAVEGPAAALPGAGAPALDLLAQSHVRHHREQVRLFAS